MQETYKIIIDTHSLINFINWLPDLALDEVFYVSLFARNKYCKELAHIKQDKQQLKRFISKKDRLFNKLQQLEVKYGAYILDDGTPIPQEALCVYIGLNSRSLERATKMAAFRFMGLSFEKYSGYNPHQEVLSIIAGKKVKGYDGGAVCQKKYYDFDLDNISYQELEQGLTKLPFAASSIWALETRGGFHLLVNMNLIDPKYKNTWFNKVNQVFGEKIDNKGTNTLIPIPGCYQGGFIPILTKY